MEILPEINTVFIVGIKGVAMTNIAIILKKMRKRVSGVDTKEIFITDEVLRKNQIPFEEDFSKSRLPRICDLVLYSAAHDGARNPLVAAARKKNIPTLSQAEFIGRLMRYFSTSIAVTGCHGKTTTASLLSFALMKLGQKPTYLVGAPTFGTFDGGDFQSDKYFVVEADEYAIDPPVNKSPKFSFLKPKIALCTNIDFDHPDVYADIDHTKDAFASFLRGKEIVACLDDPDLKSVLSRLDGSMIQTYGFLPHADLQIISYTPFSEGSSFKVSFKKGPVETFEIGLYGEKNILNASAVVLTLLKLGFSSADVKESLKGFRGAKRRFELLNNRNDTYLFDDYAHHPNEILSTIQAAHARFPERRILILFQPHTYSRTQALVGDFARALAKADLSIILPVFSSAREQKNIHSVTSGDIAKSAASLNHKNVISVPNKTEAISTLKRALERGDVIFTMGAGDIYKLKDDIMSLV